MVQRRRGLLIVFLISVLIFLLLVLRELKVLNLDWYRSQVDSTSNSQITMQWTYLNAAEPEISYGINVFHEGESIFSSQRIVGEPVLEVEVDLTPTISGLYWTPVYKSFTVDFTASFVSATPGLEYELIGQSVGGVPIYRTDTTITDESPPQTVLLAGNIDGEIQVAIIGFCTRDRALEIAIDKAAEIVGESIVNRIEQ